MSASLQQAKGFIVWQEVFLLQVFHGRVYPSRWAGGDLERMRKSTRQAVPVFLTDRLGCCAGHETWENGGQTRNDVLLDDVVPLGRELASVQRVVLFSLHGRPRWFAAWLVE